MIESVQNNINKKRNYTLLSFEQKEKIYKVDQYKFSKKAIASYYNIHRESVSNIINEMREHFKMQKLTDQDAITIIESKSSSDVVNKIVEAKAELMTAEAEAQRAEANIKNTVHSTIESSLSNNQIKADSRTEQLNKMLEKQQTTLEKLETKLLDAIDSDADTIGISTAINAVSNMIDKITTTLLKMNKSDSDLLNDHFKTLEHYGLSKKQSSINIDNRQLTLNNSTKQQGGGSDSIVDYQFAFPVLQDGFKTIADNVVEAEVTEVVD